MYHKFVSLKLIGVIFSQNYWLKVTKVLKKIRFVSKADFCGSFGLCKIAKYMILFNL